VSLGLFPLAGGRALGVGQNPTAPRLLAPQRPLRVCEEAWNSPYACSDLPTRGSGSLALSRYGTGGLFWAIGPCSRRPLGLIIDPMSGEARVERARELIEVLWRRFGQHVFLTYAEEEPEHMNGDLRFATAMAEDAELGIVESSPQMARWVRNPETQHLIRGE